MDLWDVVAGGILGAVISMLWSKKSSDKFLSDEELEEAGRKIDEEIARRAARQNEEATTTAA